MIEFSMIRRISVVQLPSKLPKSIEAHEIIATEVLPHPPAQLLSGIVIANHLCVIDRQHCTLRSASTKPSLAAAVSKQEGSGLTRWLATTREPLTTTAKHVAGVLNRSGVSPHRLRRSHLRASAWTVSSVFSYVAVALYWMASFRRNPPIR